MAMRFGFFASLAFLLVMPSLAHALSLSEALIIAYRGNPDIKRERSNVQVAGERLAAAYGASRPTLTGEGSVGRSQFESDLLPASIGKKRVSLKPITGRVLLNQPLYAGGSINAGIESATYDVEASKGLLSAREQVILRSVANAYIDVLLNQTIVDLNDKNVEVLRKQKDATEKRREAGVLTPTDVAQADARLARANTGRVDADAKLQAARHEFEEVVGRPADKLEPLGAMPQLPVSLETALEIAQSRHPSLLSARDNASGRASAVDVARGALLPALSLQGEYNYLKENDRPDGKVEEAVGQVFLRIPFYQGGTARARLREAKYQQNVARLDEELVRRQVVSAVRNAWSRLTSAKSAIISAEAQKKASTRALEGVRREAVVGSRTTLDVLDAEQELLEAEVTLTQAQMEKARAVYDVLEAIGELSVRNLDLDVTEYNPDPTIAAATSAFSGTDVQYSDMEDAGQ